MYPFSPEHPSHPDCHITVSRIPCRSLLVNHFKYSSVYMSIAAAAAKSLQSCPTLCNPIDGSPPGSPVPGILQARILEWVAMTSSKRSSQLRD